MDQVIKETTVPNLDLVKRLNVNLSGLEVETANDSNRIFCFERNSI